MSLKKTILGLAALLCFSYSPLQAATFSYSPVDSENNISFTVVFDGSFVSERTITVRNDTLGPLPIDSISVFGDGVIQYGTDNCPRGTMAAGTQCQIILTIHPIDYSLKTATLMVGYATDGVGYSNNYPINVLSVPAIRLSSNPSTSTGIIPLTGAFADAASFESRHRVQFTNNGIAATPILDILPVTSGTVRVISHNCPSTGEGLAVGASCEAILGFRPIDYSTSFVDLLVVGRSGPMEMGSGFQVAATAVAPSDLSLRLNTNTTSAILGNNITYTLSVQNTADTSSRAPLEVSMILPAGSQYLSASVGSCRYTASSREVLCILPALEARANASVDIIVKAIEAGSLEQSASLYSPTDINSANNNAQATVTITATTGGSSTVIDPDPSATPAPTSSGGGCAMGSTSFPTSGLGLILFGMASLLFLGMLRNSAKS